ncbi:beta-microseminoprotein-like [Brachyhypopomus gauderio]|uniref:beta-microseminoprotein-like n=1 Tax=Brachyhypopomus gauderio TaxID=698409 RepID=UPI00404178B3
MSTMKCSVFVVLVLCGLIPLNHAACWTERLKNGATRCRDAVDKNWHSMGSSWTNSLCHKCSCTPTLFSCCDGLPKVFLPPGCEVKYDYEACTYDVFKKDNPEIGCLYSASGK